MFEELLRAQMFCIFTGNRHNQVLVFATLDEAIQWARSATTWSDLEILKAIKQPRWNGENYLSIFDK